MGVIRAGGLASGLDTNAIIEKLVEVAKEPIVRLDNKYHLLTLEKSLYKDINNDLTAMKNNIFNLKLESTFKSKTVLSSNLSVANAKVTSEAQKGIHTVEVLQTARNASMTSMFASIALTEKGAGVKGLVTSRPEAYQQMEGTYTTKINSSYTTTYSASKAIAVSTFKASNNQTFYQYSANIAMDNTFVDSNGNINSAMTTLESAEFAINTGSGYVSLNKINLIPSNFEDIQSILGQMEAALNNQINQFMGTAGQQYVALRADYVDAGGTDNWVMSIYNVSNESFAISGVDGNGLNDLLGLSTAGVSNQVFFRETDEIVKYYVADNPSDLQAKLSDSATRPFGGLISGVVLDFESTGLVDGTFEIIQSASMNIRKATKTNVLGASISAGTVDLKAMLPSTGLDSTRLNGKFTINGVTIQITGNHADYTLNDLIGIVNGSGAGVTMTFDSATNQFKISSNQTGATNITLGAQGDTSSFLDMLKLTPAAGAVKTTGVNAGSINTTVPIRDAGFNSWVGSGVFTINDIPIYINSDESVQDLINKVNRSAAGVTLSYDSARDKFVITSNSTERIKFGGKNDTTSALEVMGFIPNYDDYDKLPMSMGTAGQNAIVRVDGQTYTRGSNIIDDILTGVTITAASKGTTTIEIDVDADKAVTAMANFIKSYNSLMFKLRPEPISKDDRKNKMDPLTAEKKSQMSENDIKAYEEEYDRLHTIDIMQKSKEFKNLLREMRANIMSPIYDNISIFSALSDIGFEIAGQGDISISQKGYLMDVSTDIETLKQCIFENYALMDNIRNNSEEVYKFFASYKEDTVYIDKTTGKPATSSSYEKNVVPSYVTVSDSWSRRFEKLLTAYQDIEGQIGIKTRVDSALEKQMTRLTVEIDRKQRSAESYLELLWSQFTNMEMRIAAMQSQTQYITQLAESANKK
ncbi:MAG: flagellar filament capping protein FliD [Deferribacteraceae bacterium]|jgi:flagellar hook-associated protein 2|nr:flagellar filament capping protein FliD [Deferribacteraceae bacterium]